MIKTEVTDFSSEIISFRLEAVKMGRLLPLCFFI